MRVLIACEFSGIVRDAFRARGHYAVSCDFLSSERLGPHYRRDVLKVLDRNWDLMIAHPPCTFLTNAGVRWLYRDPNRWEKMRLAAAFFGRLCQAPIPRKAIENPIMHKHAIALIGRRQDQVIQPWQFGHPEQKATCLWLYGLPKLRPTNNVYAQMMQLPDNQRQRLHYLGPSPTRAKDRSRTFTGIAKAMAEQWG